MFRLPERKKKPKCNITIGGVTFVPGQPKQIEINEVENFGRADCTLKNKLHIRPSTRTSWNEISVFWNPKMVSPGSVSKVTFNYEWTSGETYFFKVLTEEGQEKIASQKAP